MLNRLWDQDEFPNDALVLSLLQILFQFVELADSEHGTPIVKHQGIVLYRQRIAQE